VLLGRGKQVRIYTGSCKYWCSLFSVTSFFFTVEDYILLVNKSLLSFTSPRTFIKELKKVTWMKKNESI